MRTSFSITALATVALAFAGCGGGGDSKFSTPGDGTTTPPTTVSKAASINVLASSPSLASAGGTPLDISAYVKDANNALVKDAAVTFQATSGQLLVTQGTSDESGLAKATLAPGGDPTNRQITVTATSGTVSGTVAINVIGSQLSLQGPSAMVLSQNGTFTIRLLDSAAAGIAGKTVTITSAKSNTLSASSVTTDSSGNASFTMTIANPGNDTVTATGMGITSTLAVAVNSDAFTFTSPVANAEVALGTPQTVGIRWLSGNTPVAGQPVTFASTRGTVSSPSVVTDSTGAASVTVTSTNSGGATITASGGGTAVAQLSMEFVATTAASIDVQPSVFTLAPNAESTVTAIVRDASNNLVKNKTVTFALQDVTGGTLSAASAVTDSQGRAQSTYKAGTSTSASNGVTITATVQGTAINDSINLTVAQQQLFLVVGTGAEIEPTANTTQYKLPYVVQVTDSNSNGVANVQVSVSVTSLTYYKGTRARDIPNHFPQTITATCADEDVNHNGVLDSGEDFNSSTRIEAGNIVTATPVNAVTDANGFADIILYYPKNYSGWLKVRFDARAGVSGTEFIRSSTFTLPFAVDDFDGPGDAPGMESPFGTANSCINPN